MKPSIFEYEQNSNGVTSYNAGFLRMLQHITKFIYLFINIYYLIYFIQNSIFITAKIIMSTPQGVGLVCGDIDQDQADFHESSQLHNSGAPKSILFRLQTSILYAEGHFQ